MARKVFFSFHYENDVWRAFVVRNSWVTKPNNEKAGFIDAADFEEVKRQGQASVKRWIDGQLEGTSVTIVLIGSETSNRDYVKYELERSWERGNGIIGIRIHQVKDRYGLTSARGSDIFGPIFTSRWDSKKYFSERFETYDWVMDNGYARIGEWVESAAKIASR